LILFFVTTVFRPDADRLLTLALSMSPNNAIAVMKTNGSSRGRFPKTGAKPRNARRTQTPAGPRKAGKTFSVIKIISPLTPSTS